MIIIIVSGGDAFGGLQQQEIPQSVKLRHKGGIVLAVTYIKNYKNIFTPEKYSPQKKRFVFVITRCHVYVTQFLSWFDQVRSGNRSKSGLDKLVREPELGET